MADEEEFLIKMSSIELRAKVYTASKLHHAPQWRALAMQYSSTVLITSRWISMPPFDKAEETDHELARAGWIIDEDDIRESDYVLCFSAEGEVLRGALVEAGMGIALGKKIICCGASPSFGTWQYHPKVIARVADLGKAMEFLLADWQGRNVQRG